MSKYKSKTVECDGYVFDSKVEMEYYLHLKEMLDEGEILDFTVHDEYELQPAFVKNFKKYRPIMYESDFTVYVDGKIIVIDIKGFATPLAIMKRKMFEYHFDYELKWITYVKKYGGWCDYDELKKLRKQNKKEK